MAKTAGRTEVSETGAVHSDWDSVAYGTTNRECGVPRICATSDSDMVQTPEQQQVEREIFR